MTSKRMIFFLVGTLAGLVALSGCGGGVNQVIRSDFVEFTSEQKETIEQSGDRAYRIQDGDIFQLAFSYLKDLDQENVIVLPDGSVNLIGVDRIVLGGLTIAEADEIITKKYSKEYRDPALSLRLMETKGRRVYVLGEVKTPGLHQLPGGGIDVMGAVAVAGGFTDHAAEEGSVLVRVTDSGYLSQEIDLSGFHSVQYVELAMIQLEAYDIIYVPRSRIGDFNYFSKTVLAGILNITRIAADINYLSGATIGRY